jgi:hypothetical protein
MSDDRLDGQLLTLQRVAPPSAPPRAEIMAIVERNRVHRTRTRRMAVALAAVVVVGSGALVARTLDRGDEDGTRNDIVGAGPDVERAGPDIGGEMEGTEACGLAGPEPASRDLRDDLAGVGDVLEARFPSCFGGIVRTGPTSVDLYVVDLVPDVIEAAREMLGPGYEVTPLRSDRAFADIRALKERIDRDAGQLHAMGIETSSTGIRIASSGPRVLVGLQPYSAEAVEQLEERYGEDKLIVEEYGQTIPG